ncbi:MAG: hypothetical protein Q9164_004927 [Protoblastenia rupestris]
MSLANLGLNDWPLPMRCHYSLEHDDTAIRSAGFTLDDQDPNLAAKTWSAPNTISATSEPSSISAPARTSASFNTFASTSPAATVTASQNSSTAAPNALPGSSNLSAGASAAIGVGSTVAALSLLAALGYLFLRSRRRQQKIRPNADSLKEDIGADRNYQKPEMSAEHTRYEILEQRDLRELPGTPLHHELDNERSLQELDVNHRNR